MLRSAFYLEILMYTGVRVIHYSFFMLQKYE